MPDIPVPQDREQMVRLMEAVCDAVLDCPDRQLASDIGSIIATTGGAIIARQNQALAQNVAEFTRRKTREIRERN